MKKKITLSLFALLVVFLLIEFPLFEVSWYKMYQDKETENDVSSTSTARPTSSVTALEKKLEEKPILIQAHDSIPKIVLSGLTNYISREDVDSTTLIVRVARKDYIGYGRFIPIFKFITFGTDTKYNLLAVLKKDDEIHTFVLDGEFEIKGACKIIGICSSKKAKTLLEEEIRADIEKHVVESVIDKLRPLYSD